MHKPHIGLQVHTYIKFNDEYSSIVVHNNMNLTYGVVINHVLGWHQFEYKYHFYDNTVCTFRDM